MINTNSMFVYRKQCSGQRSGSDALRPMVTRRAASNPSCPKAAAHLVESEAGLEPKAQNRCTSGYSQAGAETDTSLEQAFLIRQSRVFRVLLPLHCLSPQRLDKPFLGPDPVGHCSAGGRASALPPFVPHGPAGKGPFHVSTLLSFLAVPSRPEGTLGLHACLAMFSEQLTPGQTTPTQNRSHSKLSLTVFSAPFVFMTLHAALGPFMILCSVLTPVRSRDAQSAFGKWVSPGVNRRFSNAPGIWVKLTHAVGRCSLSAGACSATAVGSGSPAA